MKDHISEKKHSEIAVIIPYDVVETNATCLTNLSLIAGDSRILLGSTSIWSEKSLGGGPGASHLSSPSTNLRRRLAVRMLFRVPPCRKGTIHLQTSMSSPGFEPSPYGTAVSVANHYTGWATPYDVMEEAWRVVGRLEEGQTQAEVAQAIGVSQSVISRIWNRFLETGSAGRRPGQGRRRATTPNENRYLVLTARRHRNMNATLLQQHLRSATGTTVSTQTVRNRFFG
ncbi:transposable element Tcb2 transposase [Trichonephila clavipes]|nr:transposable element Tcb2 transposase [Trichonephila clavipes]